MTITEMARKGGKSKSEKKRLAAVANLEKAREAYRAQLAIAQIAVAGENIQKIRESYQQLAVQPPPQPPSTSTQEPSHVIPS